jgi:hypothetical protein
MLRMNEKALLNGRDELGGLPRDENFLPDMKSRYEIYDRQQLSLWNLMGGKLGSFMQHSDIRG